MVLAVARSAKARLRAAVKKAAEGIEERDDVIAEMRQSGELLKDIAAEASMSLEGVRKVLHRRGLK